MKWHVLCAAAAVSCAITSAAFAQGTPQLFGENLMTPVPKGFKLGARASQGRFAQMEYIAQTETVNDWSVMITVTVIKGQLPQTPDQFSQGIANGFQQACAHGEGHKLSDGSVNGYAHTEWMVTCDLNPQTKKPEFMIMRTAQGADAFYNVQYAFRATPTDENVKQAQAYLDTTSICDTRIPERACKVQ
jgi:hypothetical protein